MLNLYSLTSRKENQDKELSKGEISSIIYHDLFDYPLTLAELIKWRAAGEGISEKKSVSNKNGFYFLEGRGGLVYKRLLRNRLSEKKMEIAKATAKIISYIPMVRLVVVTGSLSMKNSDEAGDIDFLIVTKSGSLWTTRALTLLTLKIFGIKTRRFGDKNEKDKICLNMWMDESDLMWGAKNRNIYTAHEIVQIVPLVNKNKTYESLLEKNKWISEYWPNAVKIRERKPSSFLKPNFLGILFEKLFFQIQHSYMKSRITREVVTKTRALFHPQDWGKFVLGRLSQ